ncbi:hypothetical protein BT96DRAFT_981336 [Gymnopus androsaceus JB14]|uniref:Uncharacterized protein n=1 Tax=Gymnopus androsaceus JB14 TaxID=1447944 RepID=A0A6A4GQP4_9AGAR|nr:hypothetical protein BT96DRAFT_981336 [Gymnopus androsaceus JB14]
MFQKAYNILMIYFGVFLNFIHSIFINKLDESFYEARTTWLMAHLIGFDDIADQQGQRGKRIINLLCFCYVLIEGRRTVLVDWEDGCASIAKDDTFRPAPRLMKVNIWQEARNTETCMITLQELLSSEQSTTAGQTKHRGTEEAGIV